MLAKKHRFSTRDSEDKSSFFFVMELQFSLVELNGKKKKKKPVGCKMLSPKICGTLRSCLID